MNARKRAAPVYLEVGKTWVFACAVNWPGWCRRGKGEEAALETLLDYRDRYAGAVGDANVPESLDIIGRVTGDATTDFGAPHIAGPWDDGRVAAADAGRLTDRLVSCWDYFDAVVRGAPAALRKGPRGGGRDRDAIVDHVREAERAYCSRAGVRVPPRTPWPQQREALADALRTGTPDARWPMRYTVRRVAWHVLDHAWEIEDKSS